MTVANRRKKRILVIVFLLCALLFSCGNTTKRVDLVEKVLCDHGFISVSESSFENSYNKATTPIFVISNDREIDTGTKIYREKKEIQFYSYGMFGGVFGEWASNDGAQEWYYSQSGYDRAYRFPVDVIRCKIEEINIEDHNIWISYVVNTDQESHFAYVDVLDNNTILRLWANIDDSDSVAIMKELLANMDYSKYLGDFYKEIEEIRST